MADFGSGILFGTGIPDDWEDVFFFLSRKTDFVGVDFVGVDFVGIGFPGIGFAGIDFGGIGFDEDGGGDAGGVTFVQIMPVALQPSQDGGGMPRTASC